MAKLFGGNRSDFADRKQLAADGTKFCIESATLTTQKDGKERWYCTIFFQRDGDLVTEMLTFDRSNYRDQGFQSMNDEGKFPVHSCWIENRPFKNKASGMMQNFYDLNFDEGITSCPCGDLQKPAEEADLGDLAVHPF